MLTGKQRIERMTITPNKASIVGVVAGQFIGSLAALALWSGTCISVMVAMLAIGAAGALGGGMMFGIVAAMAAKAGLGKAHA